MNGKITTAVLLSGLVILTSIPKSAAAYVTALPEAGIDQECCGRWHAPDLTVINPEFGGYEEFSHEGEEVPAETEEPDKGHYRAFYDIPLTDEEQAAVFQICEAYGVNEKIVLGQLRQESNFDRNCIGDNGKAVGISQIQPRWHRERMERLGVQEQELTIVAKSVLVQVDFMAELLQKYGDYRKALTVYRYGSLKVTQEDYATIVFGFAEELKTK